MKTRIMPSILVLLFILLQVPTMVLAQNLFRYLDENTTSLDASQSRLLSAIRSRQTSVKVDIVEINNLSSLATRQSILLNLPTKSANATLKYIDQTQDDFTWRGDVPNHQGSVLFTATGNDVTGMIHFRDTVFAIEPLGKGLQALIHLDQSKFGPDEPPNAYSGTKKNGNSSATFSFSRSASPENQSPSVSAQTNPVIDILVVYTPAAESASSNINNLISASRSTTNDICANSNVNASVSDIHSQQVNYTESGDLETDVAELQDNDGDDGLDIVHDLRDQYAADVVVLLVAPPGNACG